MNSLAVNTADKTPIEILLKVDDNNQVSAKNVYEFLELRPNDYSRWCKTNILEDELAEENSDYEVLRIEAENPKGGRPTTDYKLSVTFAKKLCMKQHNERGDQARNYFIAVENKLKEMIEAKPLDLPVPDTLLQLQMIEGLVNFAKSQYQTNQKFEMRLSQLEERQPKEVIAETEQKTCIKLNETSYSRINAYSSTAIGKAFGLSGMALNEIMSAEGVLKKTYVKKVSTGTAVQHWIVSDKYRNQKYTVQRYYGVRNAHNEKPVEITFAWTPKGVGFIVNILKYKGYTQHETINNKTTARTKKTAH